MSTDAAVQVVDGVTTMWGESLRWDDRRQRLYFVDCGARTLSWLDGGEPPVMTMELPGTPTGLVLTDGDDLVVCLDDGVHVVDPDAGAVELLSSYPPELGRANDAVADHAGNLVTGSLNLGPGPGSIWQLDAAGRWSELAGETGNTNGPNVIVGADGAGASLVVADTVAGVVYAFPYDAATPAVGERRVVSDHGELEGSPDGATVDDGDGIWSCVLRRGALARLGLDGGRRVVELPVVNPSDVAFGGPALDRLYVTTISVDLGGGVSDLDGSLLVLDVGATGRPERRYSLRSGGRGAA